MWRRWLTHNGILQIQTPTLSWMENEYQAKCNDLLLDIKSKMAYAICG